MRIYGNRKSIPSANLRGRDALLPQDGVILTSIQIEGEESVNLVKKVLKSEPAIAFAASFMVSMLIFAAFGYAPFGLKSVAGADANIQYIDSLFT